MIDLLRFQSTINAKTAPCRVRLANPNHTVDMIEAESKVPREFTPVKRTKSLKDLTGKRFTRWSVVSILGIHSRKTFYLCICDCGTKSNVSAEAIRSGSSRSCGCLKSEYQREKHLTHGRTKTPEYRAWLAMRSRCNYAPGKDYPNYGGRGISVCDRWKNSFENFLFDMGNKPSLNHTLDRKDTNGNYDPSNCKWSTVKEQCRNMRKNVVLEFEGESHCRSEWADIKGIKHPTLEKRLRLGWSVKDALTIPVKK